VYEVYLERAAERDLRRLPKEVLASIANAMKALADNPRPPGCRKLAGSTNDWRIRIREYRVLYEIDDGQKAIRVMHIRHRREAYR
jgi:mRNA interferase RelE/StbE